MALHCTYLYIILVICLRQHIKWWVIPDTCTSVILDILQEHRYFSGESVADTLEDLQLLRPSKASHIGKHAFEPLGFWTPELSWFDTRLTRLNSDVLPETGIEPSQTGLAFIFRCINMLKFHLWFKAWWHPFLDQLWWFNHPKNLLVRDHNPVFYGNKQIWNHQSDLWIGNLRLAKYASPFGCRAFRCVREAIQIGLLTESENEFIMGMQRTWLTWGFNQQKYGFESTINEGFDQQNSESTNKHMVIRPTTYNDS